MIIFKNDFITIEKYQKQNTIHYYIINNNNINDIKMIVKNF